MDIFLNDEQHEEVDKIVDWIRKNDANTLETVLCEGLDYGMEHVESMREIWRRDVEDRKQFYEDQMKNGRSYFCQHFRQFQVKMHHLTAKFNKYTFTQSTITHFMN